MADFNQFVFGASGHAKVVIDIIEKQKLHQISFLIDDEPSLEGTSFFGYEVRGGKDALLSIVDAPPKVTVAIGNNAIRTRIASWLEDQGFILAAAIHPSAQIGRDVVIGLGTVVMANAVINSGARLGKNVIVNTGASIDHDCSVEATVHIAPGARLCGGVSVGANSFVGAGATVIPNLMIGSGSVVGAGATVIRDLPGNISAVGNPAKIL